ncbi:MAG: ribosome small subunit-dependent GTPase A [Flavobacteriales bacterium]|nr:ribosome small subunit-dependent GTPase A [Flavobacteriales bacterium]MCB9448400.1 ribosome small subunit-dependent GTPase A [Flavobacteriales bacterium]
MKGIVIKSTGSRYLVEDPDGHLLDCRVRGKVRLEERDTTNPVAVGDHVEIEQKGDDWIISTIFPRTNYIVRKATKLSSQRHIIAANIDRAYLVVTPAFPRTSFGFIDRFLVTAEAYHIPVTLIFNKADLFREGDAVEVLEEMKQVYEAIGYPCLVVSAYNEKDVQILREQMQHRTQLMSGHSGVGKSTLIKALEPRLDLVTKEISPFHLKGQHATTFAEMHRVTGGGYIIDTPGIKELGLVDIPRDEISHYFVEMRALLPGCRFNNCMHVNEPGCAVLEAVKNDMVTPTRYQSYLGMLEETENLQK